MQVHSHGGRPISPVVLGAEAPPSGRIERDLDAPGIEERFGGGRQPVGAGGQLGGQLRAHLRERGLDDVAQILRAMREAGRRECNREVEYATDGSGGVSYRRNGAGHSFCTIRTIREVCDVI